MLRAETIVALLLRLTIVCLLLTASAAGAGPAQAVVNAPDPRKLTPLERAIAQGDVRGVRAMIQAGANVNARDAVGWTPLSWAAFQDQVEITRSLVHSRADLNAKNQQGRTAIEVALDRRHFDVVEALIEGGAAADREEIRRAVNTPEAGGETLLELTRDLPTFRTLLKLGADPNTGRSSRTLLAWAASVGDIDRVRALIDAGADVNLKDSRGWTALLLAAGMGYTAVIEALVKVGADASPEGPPGWTALMRAAYFGKFETVRALIPVTDVNHRNKDGATALMLARWACHPEVVEALTRAGAVADPSEWRRAPRFDDFPMKRVYKGTPARVDLSSHPQAREYRTRLREGAHKGPNFAGHYTVVGWGCGSNCESTMIVDALTGRVYSGAGDERGAEFKLTSNLFIADPSAPEGGAVYVDNPVDHLPARYFVWINRAFKPIFEEACFVVDHHQKCGCEEK